jgi:hypothetical protein
MHTPMRLCACALVLLSKEALVEQSVQIRRYTSPYLRLNRSIARAYWVPRQINSASLYSAELLRKLLRRVRLRRHGLKLVFVVQSAEDSPRADTMIGAKRMAGAPNKRHGSLSDRGDLDQRSRGGGLDCRDRPTTSAHAGSCTGPDRIFAEHRSALARLGHGVARDGMPSWRVAGTCSGSRSGGPTMRSTCRDQGSRVSGIGLCPCPDASVPPLRCFVAIQLGGKSRSMASCLGPRRARR